MIIVTVGRLEEDESGTGISVLFTTGRNNYEEVFSTIG